MAYKRNVKVLARSVPSATSTGWASALGIDQKTFLRRWTLAGNPQPARGKVLTAREVFAAMTGDLHAARARQALADAELSELKARQLRESVIDVDTVRKFIVSKFAPIREDVISLPTLLSAKCNPEHPEVARAALTEWGDVFLARRKDK